MRVAFFTKTFLPKVDGIVNTLCHLLEHLARRGHESILFAPAGGPMRYAKTPIIGLPGYPSPLYPELKLVPPYVDVIKFLKTFNPDVVHLVNPVSLGLIGLRHARQLGLPVVASYHTDIPGFIERWAFVFVPIFTNIVPLQRAYGSDIIVIQAREDSFDFTFFGFMLCFIIKDVSRWCGA